MNEFKIGDEVEVIKPTSKRLGEKGRVEEIYVNIFNKTFYFVELKNGILFIGDFGDLKPITPKPFSKDDLKKLEGAKIELRNGLIGFYHSGGILGWSDTFPLHIENFNDDFTYFGYTNLDITKVTLNDKVLFEREEIKYYMDVVHKSKDGLGGNYNDKAKLLNDIEKLLNDKDLIRFEVSK